MTFLPPTDPATETDQLTRFITDTFTRAKKTTALIAISGGVDSATSLMLAAKALTPEHIFALFLPSKTTPATSLEHIKLLLVAAHLDPTHLITIPISGLIQKSWRIISRSSSAQKNARSRTPPGRQGVEDGFFEPKTALTNRIRLANIAARLRMMVLFDQAKKLDALVIGTENLSEHLLGYYTRHGDEASDLEPIRHLYKTQVIELAKYLGVPLPIIDKPPSADLWLGQTDSQELGFTYLDADPILYLINQGKSEAEICQEGFKPELVKQVIRRVTDSAFKHQVPYLIQGES